MANNKLAIIGGSGLYDVEEFKDRELIKLDTPWGKPSDDILKTLYNSKEVYFLPRHGRGHFISPSNINFRANIDALKQLGITDIVSISAVGSLKENLPPGKFVIVDQFIDRTFARKKTFFDNEIVAHVSMAHPTSNGLMNACEESIKIEPSSSRTKLEPISINRRKVVETSLSWGVFASFRGPSAKIDAKKIGKVAFFEPEVLIFPLRGVPP